MKRVKRQDYTGRVYETEYLYSSYYDDLVEDEKYWELPEVIKVNFIGKVDQLGCASTDGQYFTRDIESKLYHCVGTGMVMPFYAAASMLSSGNAEPVDTNIFRVGKKAEPNEQLQQLFDDANNHWEDYKKYLSEGTKKAYNIEEEKMDLFKPVDLRKTAVLKRDFKTLPKGTEFVFDENGYWVFEEGGEDIGENTIVSIHSKIKFLDSYVRNNQDIFDLPDIEDKAKMDRSQKIRDLESLVENTLEEINKLKEEK